MDAVKTGECKEKELILILTTDSGSSKSSSFCKDHAKKRQRMEGFIERHDKAKAMHSQNARCASIMNG